MFNILSKIRQRIIINDLNKSGIIAKFPIRISDTQNLICFPPVYIGPEAWMELRGKLYIGAGTIIGPRFKVHTSNHNYNGNMLPYDDKYLVKDVKIGENVWVGSDVTILPGIEIGEGVVIGAGAVVSKNVPPMAIIGGNPAKIIKYRDSETYHKLKNEKRIYLKYKEEGKTELIDSKRIINVKSN